MGQLKKTQLLKPSVLATYVPGLKSVIHLAEKPGTDVDCNKALDIEEGEDYMELPEEPIDEEPNPIEEVDEDKEWRKEE